MKSNPAHPQCPSLLGTSVGRDNTVDLTQLGLHTHDLAELDLPFTAEEVWRTIEQLPPEIKHPGLMVSRVVFTSPAGQ
jgi:hypothetical protein